MVLGIDPGLTGGFVVLSSEGEIISSLVMPIVKVKVGKNIRGNLDLPRISDYISQLNVNLAVLEKVSAMPGQGVSSMFKFGQIYGALEAMLVAHRIKYELVTPRVWSKVIHSGIDMTLTPKERSLLVVNKLFPGESFLATSRSRVPHLGLIDAALLAEYGRRSV